MSRAKMPDEYYLNRIREFQKKHKRIPKSNELNGNFFTRVKKIYGTWEKGVEAATGELRNYGKRTEEELLDPIRKFYAAHNRMPAILEIPRRGQVIKVFGSHGDAMLAALGFHPERIVLDALRALTVSVELASINEIQYQLKQNSYNVSIAMIRGTLVRYERKNFVSITHGDRVRLYRITNDGKNYLKDV